MIKAKPYQEQPPRSAQCKYCGEAFNNERRLRDHVGNKVECHEKWLDEGKRIQAA